MNDLPQYELLSAYLDGELSAAEQAEVERLLAASPAARQLLGELRSLSTAIQALPRESVSEDLSPQVLLAAQRRMSAEEGPGDTETVPTPLARSVVGRFINRRALVWAGLAVAIAVLITINERRQSVPPAGNAAKELARAEPEKLAGKPGLPPSIHAPQDGRSVESLDRPARLSEGKSAETDRSNAASAPAARPSPYYRVEKSKKEDVAGRSGGARRVLEQPAAAASPSGSNTPLAPLPAAAPGSAAKSAKGGPVAGKAGTAPDFYRKDSDAHFGYVPRKSGDVKFGADKDEAAGEKESAQDAFQAGQRVMVVRCDISPEAVRRRAFDKLLLANNITPQPQSDEKSLADVMQDEVAELAKKRNATGQVHMVYVEATPAADCGDLGGFADPAQGVPVFLGQSGTRRVVTRAWPSAR